MIELDASAVLLQWAAGGMLFVWVTTRHRVVGLGYGWTMRIVYLLMALGALLIAWQFGWQPTRDIPTAGLAVLCSFGLIQSYRRRSVGVSGQRQLAEKRSSRVAAMTGIDRSDKLKSGDGPEFDPLIDLATALVGFVGVIAAGIEGGTPVWLSVVRMVIGALFLGVVSDAMLLGHWYLVQPGLDRSLLVELVRWTGILWLPETIVFLLPTGMLSVLNGTIDDGYGGLLGWFWVACVLTTIGLVVATIMALREKTYSAVMAATGLLYLAILMGFGIDLVARAALSL